MAAGVFALGDIGLFPSGLKLVMLQYTPSTSYDTGGDAPGTTLSDELSTITTMYSPSVDGLHCEWDPSKVEIRHYDYDAVADGASIEVASTSDNQASVFQLMFVGRA